MKKVVSALLIMLMLIQTVSFAADNKVYSEEETMLLVDKLSTLGIFEEFDNNSFFDDDAGVKRYEAAVVISSMLGMKEPAGNNLTEIKFFDVPQDCNYINAVNYVANLGIMTGNSAGLFRTDETMEIAHVYKAIVVALGYGWKAEAYGGYPAGYVKVAAELEISNAISKGINETASRLDFLKMIDAALDAPICRMKSISGNVMDFEVDEAVTVLSEYHDIYTDEGVVENSKSMNMTNVEEIDKDVVYIGGRKLFVNGVTDVYAYFGYKVDYYYRHDAKAEANYLISVTPSDENTELKISRADFGGLADGKITYYNEEGKEKEIKVSSSAAVFYNGEVVTDASAAINSFEGTLTLIDNNDDKHAEVVIAKNYTYDKVKSIKAAENKIYAINKVFNLDSYEAVDIILVATGEQIPMSSIETGSIIGYATSTDGKKLAIDVLGTGIAVNVKSTSQDDFTTDDGAKYNTSLLSAEHSAMIKPNAIISLVVIDGYYAVWVGTASETVSMGYLINVAVDSSVFGESEIVGARILDINGNIKAYAAANAKKMILNGKSLTVSALIDELARIKAEYRLGGDGRVSQLVGYKLDDEGNLSHIYTVDNEDENTQLYLKYGFGRSGAAKFYSNAAYNTASFISSNYVYRGVIDNVHDYYKRGFMLTIKTPIFKVPETNQETAGEEWYAISYGAKQYEGETVNIESFTNNKLGILPKAVVEYLPIDSGGAGTVNVFTEGKLLMIDSTYQTLNSDDGADYVVSGLCEGNVVTYTVDSEKLNIDTIDTRTANAADPDEEKGFTIGDLAVVQLDSLNRIVQIEKVYDRETGNIHPNLSTEDTTDQTCALILHIYNKPDDGYGLEFFEEDLTHGVPGDERKLMLNLHALGSGNVNERAATFSFYDDTQEKVYLGSTLNIVDYQQDPENYTRIFAVHRNSGISVVFYNN